MLFSSTIRRMFAAFLALSAVLSISGCYNHHAASLPDMAGFGLVHRQGDHMHSYTIPARQTVPLAARLPANLAVARIQSAQSRRHEEEVRHYQDGGFHAVRALLTSDHRRRLNDLRGIAGVIALAPPPKDRQDISALLAVRREAVRAGADLVLVFSFQTRTENNQELLPPLSLLTLGMSPHIIGEAESTAHALLLDARSGFILAYGSLDASAWQLANAWTLGSAERDVAHRAERKAISALIRRLEPQWRSIEELLHDARNR